MMATKKKAAKSKVSKKKASPKTKKSSSLDKKREALKKRQEHNTKNKGKKNNSGERYLNFDEIDEVKFIDLKSGKQEINIIPYEITTKKHPQLDVLEIGDKVAYGYLHSINWDIQGAVFKLNEVGVTKDKIIYLYESDKE